MDFSFFHECKELHKRVLSFASTLSKDILQRDGESLFSREEWVKCAQFGILSLPFPEEYGGTQSSLEELCIAIEAMGEGCADRGLVFSLCAHLFACCIPIWKFGDKSQKEKWLPKMIDGTWIAANVATEPESGSDIFSLKTTAQKTQGGYIINGSKIFATNSPVSDLFLCYAKTSPKMGYLGTTAFIIPSTLEGITLGKNFHKIGLRTSPLGTVYFENCFVPEECRLGKEGNGGRIFEVSMAWERTFLFAFYVGLLKHQLDFCCDYAKSRKQGKSTIASYQSISHKIVEMKLRLEIARLLLYKAVFSMDRQDSSYILDSCLAKLYISQAAIQSGLDAIQIHGGTGTISESNIERMLRDAIPSTIFSGTNEIIKEKIARELLG
ncbi:MAG: acyl-CoA/acyl-ACP dehydrogenase [Candidatus Brocadiae bacterium]|nr:acyl-CoA/acyl-ACP dehydrogenase [Candidatus Brocadiia bacterium]